MKVNTTKFVLLALLCLSRWAASQDFVPLAARQLATADVFAFGGTGYAGQISAGERNFKNLMALPRQEALSTLETVFAEGNPQAKAYALAGFHKLDAKRFATLAAGLAGSQIKVRTMEGCIAEEKLLRSLASEIGSGKYDPLIRSHREVIEPERYGHPSATL
jgi:hypothetical protein